ncbi:MAG TPA: pitrilysin family protein [Methylocella sp.]|nr:pitrilysin family protein [Methylocella sp.]
MSAKITVLPSGLRIATQNMPHLETASLGVFVGAGSRHESLQENGLSHLLEHMAFKGTKRRSARDIAEEIETVGGELNAATSTEQTAYYAHTLSQDVPLALDIFADILLESTFDSAEIEREKKVILQEIGAVEDTPEDLIFDDLSATAFPNQPIGRPILGSKERVAQFRRDDVANYLSDKYRSDGTVIAAAGAIDHAQLCEEAERHFARLPCETGRDRAAPARYVGGTRETRRKLEQVHVAIGFEGANFTAENFYPLQIFTAAVGGGMSSRLFQEVREARALAYSIHAFHWGYSDTGVFGFYSATNASDLDELLSVALESLGQATLDLGDEEIHRAKAQLKVSLLSILESPSARCEQIARQIMIFGRILAHREIIDAVDRADAATIRAAGARALRSPPTAVTLGPAVKACTQEAVAMRLRGL